MTGRKTRIEYFQKKSFPKKKSIRYRAIATGFLLIILICSGCTDTCGDNLTGNARDSIVVSDAEGNTVTLLTSTL